MKTLKELGLSKKEIKFVEKVFLNPGCKIYECCDTRQKSFPDKNGLGASITYSSKPLYTKPEKLGLIETVGSYKWKVTDKVKMVLMAVS